MSHLYQSEIFLNNLLGLVKETGAFIKKEFSEFSRELIEIKGHNDLVSYVDKESERKLVEGCTALDPEAGFILEESGLRNHETARRWIIDPVDGTTDFVHGIPAYVISVGYQVNGKTIIGVVYDPERDEMFYARKDGGAFLNGKKISVSDKAMLADSVIATGFPYEMGEIAEVYMELLRRIILSSRAMRRFGSAALDLAWVAAGRFDAFYEMKLNAWDVAGGALIVQEAGGKVTDFGGGDNYIFGKRVLATNGNIHEEMLKEILNVVRE